VSLFEVYFLYVQIVVIGAVCIWCASYGLTLILRFLIALTVWLRSNQGVGEYPVSST